MQHPLYTIGHGTRRAEDFLALLRQYGIEYLVDVRSRPFSRFNPQYNQKALKQFLEENAIQYVFMGKSLGGKPEDRDCYQSNGKPDYNKIKTKDFFKQGIERLQTASAKDVRAAIMCSESKPSDCHRTKLIGNVLSEAKIPVIHIDEKGNPRDHEAVVNGVDQGLF